MISSQAYATNIYKSNQVTTASGKKLLIMLYDGAIKNLKLSEKYINERNIEKSNLYICKTQDILTELMSTLNFEVGGEFAENLYQLYQYMYKRLIHGNVNKDSEAIVEIKGYLEELRETWIQV